MPAALPSPLSPVEVRLRAWIAQALVNLNWPLETDRIPFEHPAIESHGDWSTPLALQLFAQRGQFPDSPLASARSPREVADRIVAELQRQPLESEVAKLEVAGPGFINIGLSATHWRAVATQVLQANDQYGRHDTWTGQTWEIEHTSPNPNKAMHLGHLRNNVTAMSVSYLWEAMGVRVIRDTVDNNRGIAIAKLMWGFLKFARRSDKTPVDLQHWMEHPEEWHTPESAGQRPDRFMDALYVQGSQDTEANPEVEAMVRQWVVQWEAKDPAQWKLWEHVLEYVYAGQEMTFQRLHNQFDKIWHEHEHYEAGKALVQFGLENGVFRTLPDGAVLTNLEGFGLSDTIVQKKDGTALYITQDLALTKIKKETYQADRMIWVVGPEQSLALQQMFAVCEQLGIAPRDTFEHLTFGYMSIKGQGKMSSRKGNTIFIDDLLDMARDATRERINNENLTAAEKDAVAELLAESAVKYAILKVGRTTDSQFDIETSVSLDGDSGPYLQYTHARCQSILRQAEEKVSAESGQEAVELHASEVAVLRWLERFPEMVAQSAAQSAPNLVAQYLYELAQRFNAMYAQVSVLQAESPALRTQRLQEVAAVATVLRQGFALLGFAAVDRM